VTNCRWSRRRGLLLVALSSLALPARVDAQTPLTADALKTEIYFGLRADGQAVADQAWEAFVAQVVVPRFPEGLTILDGRGQSGAGASLASVKVLVLVHPNSPGAQTRLGEIKTEFKKRFGSARVFHTDQPVRVHAEN
jgi:uncharacterized protein DUF3574